MIDFVITFDKEIFCKYGKYIINIFLDKYENNHDIRQNIFHKGILKKSKTFIILTKLKLGFLFEHINCMRDQVSDNIQTSFNL